MFFDPNNTFFRVAQPLEMKERLYTVELLTWVLPQPPAESRSMQGLIRISLCFIKPILRLNDLLWALSKTGESISSVIVIQVWEFVIL